MSPNMLSKNELIECYEILEKQGFKLKEKNKKVEAWIRYI
jgi:hypothetical protein